MIAACIRVERGPECSNLRTQQTPGGKISTPPTTATGAAPHGIRFADDKVYIVASGADQIEIYVQNDLTGKRPYPADVTGDGVLAFVPNRGENTVSVIDLLNQKELARTAVCENPEGGSLSADEVSYLVACGGDDHVMWINTASFEVTHSIGEVIGPRPFSVVASRDGRWGFVNNAGGKTVSVIDMKSGQVRDSIEVGQQPIVMRQHGERLYVTSEVSNTLAVIGLPAKQQERKTTLKNQVIVLGMSQWQILDVMH